MRSAKAVKITDLDLIKRLGIIVSVFVVFLSIRTMVSPPHVIVAKTADDLKAYICQTDWWDHAFTASKRAFAQLLLQQQHPHQYNHLTLIEFHPIGCDCDQTPPYQTDSLYNTGRFLRNLLIFVLHAIEATVQQAS